MRDRAENEVDAFDRLYLRWAERAMDKRLDPPSRERWDEIVLRLLLSEDPQRVKLYRQVEATGEDSLGGDAYHLWTKMPDYTADRTAPIATLRELEDYAGKHRGSMWRLMEARGLGDRYLAVVAAQPRRGAAPVEGADKPVDPARARRAQMNVMIIGCAGIGAIIFMALTVLLIVALKTLG